MLKKIFYVGKVKVTASYFTNLFAIRNCFLQFNSLSWAKYLPLKITFVYGLAGLEGRSGFLLIFMKTYHGEVCKYLWPDCLRREGAQQAASLHFIFSVWT